MMRSIVILASLAMGSAFLFPGRPAVPSVSGKKGSRLYVVVGESSRAPVPMPKPTYKPPTEKTFVFLWIDHLGNRVYKSTESIGPSPRRIKLWNPLVPEDQQDYPEAGVQSVPTFTKWNELTEDNLDDWVDKGFGEFEDVEDSPVAYTVQGHETAQPAVTDAHHSTESQHDAESMSAQIEAQIKAYNEYYPPATFEAMVEAMRQSWRTIILSRGKQGAKAMREFYRDLHKAHPELEEKVWVMETHATRSPVPGDADTYNDWMADEDILKMARVATEGHDDVVDMSGLGFEDVIDGISGTEWVTIPPPLSWFEDAKKT